MTVDEEKIREITTEVGVRFRTIGGGVERGGSFLSAALKDQPLAFALGVEVEDVVRFVLEQAAL